MDVRYELRRLGDVIRAVFASRALARHDRWRRDDIRRLQHSRLAALVRHARARSPFYRDLYHGIDPAQPIVLADLPRIDKRMVMANFDRVVTDPRLRLEALQAHLGALRRDAYYLGQYRVLTTAGTTGLRGIFVFNRREWSIELANALRWQRMMGVAPRFPARVRISAIGAATPLHVSARLTDSSDVGLFRLQRLAVTAPLATLVAALNPFQPEVLLAYPSIAALLAEEQLTGRLRIRPRVVSTHSERLTARMAHLIAQAWGLRPFDHYGLTEVSTFGAECAQHGLHMLDDLFIAEIVDEAFRPVVPGQVGRHLLLTNLYNRTQPLIRYDVSDMLALSPEPCPCGRPFPTIARLAGRSEEVITLAGANGQPVAIAPLALDGMIESLEEITEFQVQVLAGAIRLRFVPRRFPLDDDRVRAMAGRITGWLAQLGAAPVEVAMEQVPALERGGMGKLHLIAAQPLQGG